MNEKIQKIRELCTCGLHGLGTPVDDTPEIRERLKNCPAYELAGPPINGTDWYRKVAEEEIGS